MPMSSEALCPRPQLVRIPRSEEPGSESAAQKLAQREDCLRALWLSTMATPPPRPDPDGLGKWLVLMASGMLAGVGLGVLVAASLTIVPRGGSELSALLRDARDLFRGPLSSSLMAESLAQAATVPVTPAPAPGRAAAQAEAPHSITAPPRSAPGVGESEPVVAAPAQAIPVPEEKVWQSPAPSAPEPEPNLAITPSELQPILVPAMPAPQAAAPEPAVAAPAADPDAFRRALAAIKAQMDAQAGAPPAMPSLPELPLRASPQP
jgi:hypothetical protein